MAAAPNYSTDTSILPESNDQYGTQSVPFRRSSVAGRRR